jgi:hypothetical protein
MRMDTQAVRPLARTNVQCIGGIRPQTTLAEVAPSQPQPSIDNDQEVNDLNDDND